MGVYRVLRVSVQDFSQLPNKTGTLDAELVLREIPGKSIQRRRHLGWIGISGRVALHDPPSCEVAGVAPPPVGLSRCAPLSLTLSVRARALAIAYARVRTKPSSTETAGALATPLGHAKASRARAIPAHISPLAGGSFFASRHGSFLASAEVLEELLRVASVITQKRPVKIT